MKNIQVIDDADNVVYDIFSATDDDFSIIFPAGHDIAFIEEVFAREHEDELSDVLARIWTRRISMQSAMGIHGILFYGLEDKKQYYPTRKNEEAVNFDGTKLRKGAL